MVQKIGSPTIIESAGNKPKQINEFIGRVNTNTNEISIAKMVSPQGWVEPGQQPEFNEYTVVLEGILRLKLVDKVIEVRAGEAVIVNKDEWVQYSTPYQGGAEYVAICLPAFSPEGVNRDSK